MTQGPDFSDPRGPNFYMTGERGGLGSRGFNPYAYGGRGTPGGWGNMQGGIGGLLRAMQFRPPQNMAALRNQNFTGGS
jgi:hypothetical protein